MKTITGIEFKQEMDEIIKTFGPKAYSEKRMRIIWQYAKRCTLSEFKVITNELLSSSQRPPLPDDFRALLQRRTVNMTDVFANIPECTKCRNTGLISATLKATPWIAPFTFRCDCARGDYFQNFSRWQSTDELELK